MGMGALGVGLGVVPDHPVAEHRPHRAVGGHLVGRADAVGRQARGLVPARRVDARADVLPAGSGGASGRSQASLRIGIARGVRSLCATGGPQAPSLADQSR